jgi:hypothetical protein
MGREGIEPLVVHLAYFFDNRFTGGREEHDPIQVARVRVELTNSRRFELRRFSSLRTAL